MGVDIVTYRARIGTFKHAFGQDVVTRDVLVDIPSFRRIIIWEMLCVLVIIMALRETSLVLKCPHEFKNTIHGLKWDHCHVADSMMSLTLHFILEVIGYSILLTAVLPELYSRHTGISTSFGPNVSRKNICNDSKMNVLRHMLTTKSISIFCMVGSVSFIGMLLLMAGVESNPGPNEGKNTCKSKPTESEIHPLLKRLDLAGYFPGKIQLFDVISIGQEDIVSLEGREETKIPWILLRKLMSLNETAFDLDSEERKVDASASNNIDETSNDEEDSDSMNFDELPIDEENISDRSKAKLNYLDVFLIVYQCCCPMLQQLLFQKMFLCRFAVPFLITPLCNDKHIVSVWPMRSLVVESCSEDNRIHEYNVLDLPIKCIAFCRIGRPKLSKSQLLNRFVLDESSKTFFNYNCQSGNVSKSVCIGYTETFWLLKAGTDIDKFNDAAMFLNMRGCVRSFCKQKLTLLSRFVDAMSVFIQKDELKESKGELEHLTSLFETVIVVIVGSSTMSINEVIRNLTKYARGHKCTLSFVETYNRKAEELKSEKNITEEIVRNIKIKTKTKLAKSFETRLKECSEAQECSNEQYKQSVCDYTLETRPKYGSEAQIEKCKYDITLEMREKECANKQICTDAQNEKGQYGETSKSQVNERTVTHISSDKQIEGCKLDATLAMRVKECTGAQLCSEKQTEKCECAETLETSVKEGTGALICTEEQNEKCERAKTLETPVKQCTDAQICTDEQNENGKFNKILETRVKECTDAQICTDEEYISKQICTDAQHEKGQYGETSKSQVNERTDTHICSDKQIEECKFDEALATRVKECTGAQLCSEKQTEKYECAETLETSVKECTGAQICTEEQNEKCDSAKILETPMKECTGEQICTDEQNKKCESAKTLEMPVKECADAQICTDEEYVNKQICTDAQHEKGQYGETSKSQVNERTVTHICSDKQIEECKFDETLATRVKECTGAQLCSEKQTEKYECAETLETSVKECTGAQICTEEQNEKCDSAKILETPMKECTDEQICTDEQNKNCESAKTLEMPVKECAEAQICTDEQNEACKYGETQALEFCKMVNLDAEFLSLKEKVTPLQSSFAKKLGKFLKELKRDQDIKVQDKTREKIKIVRNEMKENVTEPIKQILNVLYDNTSLEKIDYFLAWLRFYISRSSRRHLSELKLRHHEAWKNFQTRKHEQQNLDGVKREIMIVESKVDAASFSVGHLFREIGLIYDNMFELKLSTKTMNIPSVKQIASVIGKLMANGHQLELIDGESFYLPRKWLSKVFVSLDKEIHSSKIMTLSVLGIQSSGKSTLLNTMFGALFSTSAGRCTRGIHAQLIPLHPDFISQRRIAYQYILILDTEGLRPTEVIHESHEHDNELATLIAGLGNTTIVNVMGENTKEIRDILQIVAHAFLRIKLANEHISLHNRCILVQQNITAITAKDSLNDGLNKFVTNLDEMTQDSARCEGVKDIYTFNQVLSFDISSDVWYLKNVWHGDPPFGRVNRNYSETASRMKLKLFKQVLEVNKSHYTPLHSFIERTNDLWQGVLNENFVFSFRNSIERRAYSKMDECTQGKLWEIEFYLTKETYTIAQKEFSNCHTLEKIKDCETVIIERLNTIINDKTAEAEKFFKEYFDESDHRHIIVQWEENQRGRVIRFFDKIRDICKVTVRNERTKIKTNLQFQSSQKENEEALRKKTLDFAKTNPVKSISQNKIKVLFEEIWTESFGKLDPSNKVDEYTLKHFFYSWLIEMHTTQSPILKDILLKVNWLGNTNVYSPKSLTVENTGIDDADISFTTYEKFKKIFYGQRERLYAAEQFVQILYKDITNKIEMLCRENNQISESHIRELLRYIHEQYASKQLQESKVTFKEKFFVKIDVYVSIVANNIFEEHNKKYRQTLRENYESCKRQQMLLFKGYLAIRKSEDIVADIVTEVIHRHIDSESVVQVSHQIRHILHGKLPGNKNRLIIDICDELVDANDFERIISYIKYPFETAQMWFEHKANSFLFEENSRQFSKCSLRIVDDLLSNVIVSLMSLKGNCDEMITSNDLVSRLLLNLKNNKIFIPETDFGSVKRCNQVAKINLTAVCNAVDSKLKALIVKLKGLFSSYTEDTVRWKEHCPVQNMFENIWGCCELCPYCNEPCEKSTESHTEDHTCVQHRPTCCSGMMVEGLEQACSETCNYDIHANSTHKCSAFNYKCNGEKSNCEQKVHQYRDYRVFLKDWFIPPSSDMHDSSKFWLWFVGSFKKELTEMFGYKIANIPDSWSQISSDDAKESLRTTYKD